MIHGSIRPELPLAAQFQHCLEKAQGAAASHDRNKVTACVKEFSALLQANIDKLGITEPKLNHTILEMKRLSDSEAYPSGRKVMNLAVKSLIKCASTDNLDTGLAKMADAAQKSGNSDLFDEIVSIGEKETLAEKKKEIKTLLSNREALEILIHNDGDASWNHFVTEALFIAGVDFTPLDFALIRGDAHLAQGLIRQGAKPDLEKLSKMRIGLNDLPPSSQKVLRKATLADAKKHLDEARTLPASPTAPSTGVVQYGGKAAGVVPMAANAVTFGKGVSDKISEAQKMAAGLLNMDIKGTPAFTDQLANLTKGEYVKMAADIPDAWLAGIGLAGNAVKLGTLVHYIMKENPEIRAAVARYDQLIDGLAAVDEPNRGLINRLIDEKRHLLAEEVRRVSSLKADAVAFGATVLKPFATVCGPIAVAAQGWSSWNAVENTQEKLRMLQGTIDRFDEAIAELKILSETERGPMRGIYAMKISDLEEKKSAVMNTAKELRSQGLVPAVTRGIAAVSMTLIAAGCTMWALGRSQDRDDYGVNQFQGQTMAIASMFAPIGIMAGRSLWGLGGKASEKIQEMTYGRVEDREERLMRLSREELSKLLADKKRLEGERDVINDDLKYGIPSNPLPIFINPGSKEWEESMARLQEIESELSDLDVLIKEHEFARKIGLPQAEAAKKMDEIARLIKKDEEFRGDLISMMENLGTLNQDNLRQFEEDPVPFIKQFISL